MKPVRRTLVCGLIIFGLAAVCYGYVLPAGQILGLMIRALGSCQSLMIKQKTVIYDPVREEMVKELSETIYYAYPDRFRSEISARKMEQLQVSNGDDAVVVVDGEIIREADAGFDHFKDLLLYTKAGLLADRLIQLGIDMEVVSLGRFEESIAYVIGARYPDESVPQAWIEKDSFRPLRLLLGGGYRRNVPLREIQFADYRLLGQGKHYPARIRFLEDGKLVKTYELESFEIDPAIAEHLFDIGHLRSVYGPFSPRRFQEDR